MLVKRNVPKQYPRKSHLISQYHNCHQEILTAPPITVMIIVWVITRLLWMLIWRLWRSLHHVMVGGGWRHNTLLRMRVVEIRAA